MINNRQNGRRRGRGGAQRPQSNVANQGNRQDNRSRGNAAQLHEKYKALARDTQLSGDRVQTEYFLQFADHYYRVLNESRARFEEQRRQRDDYDDDEDQDETLNAGDGDDGQDSDDRPEPRRQRNSERSGRDQGGEREQRPPREARDEREPRPSAEQAGDRDGRAAGERRPRRERPRRDRSEEPQEGQTEERISLEALPPPIASDASEAPAKPVRRRTRRPGPDTDVDIAPAA